MRRLASTLFALALCALVRTAAAQEVLRADEVPPPPPRRLHIAVLGTFGAGNLDASSVRYLRFVLSSGLELRVVSGEGHGAILRLIALSNFITWAGGGDIDYVYRVVLADGGYDSVTCDLSLGPTLTALTRDSDGTPGAISAGFNLAASLDIWAGDAIFTLLFEYRLLGSTSRGDYYTSGGLEHLLTVSVGFGLGALVGPSGRPSVPPR